MHDNASPSPSNSEANGSHPLKQKAHHGTSTPKARGSVGSGESAALIEEYYEQWRIDPSSVDTTWRSFFEGFELGCQQAPPKRKQVSSKTPTQPDPKETPYLLKQARIYNLLFAYRTLGHNIANLDPLQLCQPEETELDIHHFKLDSSDLNTEFDSGKLAGGGQKTLQEIISILKKTYCNTIGVEYMHIQNVEIRRWLRDKMELCQNTPHFSSQKKRRILNRVMAAELFEKFLHTRYVAQKRFSLEGGETLIPMLDGLIEKCPEHGVNQIVMGMAHRGRLNVLANILGKSYKSLFDQFAENYIPLSVHGDGDVKYHLGMEASVTTSSGDQIGISLAPNPSHLEAVGPVVQGKARAWQRLMNDTDNREKVIPVLIHGDAAFIAQGVVSETFNLSQLPGYCTGGTLHVVVNNQIGFTTVPSDARSSIYCTSIAKMLGLPIFHVNGDDPLSAVYLMELAMEFRQRFHKDVIIDLYCYRRHGHNEGDEPNFTQPTLYSEIKSHPLVSESFIPELIKNDDITQEKANAYRDKFQKYFEQALSESRKAVKNFHPEIRKPLSTPQMLKPVPTSIKKAELMKIGKALSEEPKKTKINAKLKRWLETRRKMLSGEQLIDWSLGEALAFGSLLIEGTPIRLSGQDSRRGTFSHRHSVFYDLDTRKRYIPLKNISKDQEKFCVYNSPLSEAAVLGFDFGYSLDYPNMLCIWEAQFGDFANGAQVMIDQYITSSESKWEVTSNMVLLLPHGYEGQGPEHSSARLERFLQLCAEDNIQVVNCTSPANYFHALRRQAKRKFRKPLVVMTPKSLLRNPKAVSTIEDFTKGAFEEILPGFSPPSKKVKKLILCSGKVFYDLEKYREDNKITNTAICRVEQLYPLHAEKLANLRSTYSKDITVVWCQEESQNMGAWTFIEPQLRKIFNQEIQYAGRDASSSPATGSLAIHQLEQQDLIQQAFTT